MASSYEIPVYGTQNNQLTGWLTEAVQEGEAWLRNQRPTQEWEKTLDLLSPSNPNMDLADQSNAGYNKIYRVFRELIASLSDFQHEGVVSAVQDANLFDQAITLTKLDEDWKYTTFARERVREILQYAGALGTGYGWQVWDKDFDGVGRGNVSLQALSGNDVTFVQLPRSHDVQKAYMVIIKQEVPINLAKREWALKNPAFAAALRPDRGEASWITKGLRKVQQAMGGSPALRVGGMNKTNNNSFPTVDIYHCYTMDMSLNESGRTIRMGPDNTNYCYDVPSLGSDLPTGQTQGGIQLYRKAERPDAMMFPLRRLTIFSKSAGVGSDDTSPWWHGEAPLVKFRYNDVAWEALGRSLVGDARTLQDGIQQMMRDIEDSSNAKVDPPALYDENRVDKTFAASFNPRKGGVRAQADLDRGAVIQFPVPPENYNIAPWQLQYLSDQEKRIDYITAVNDMTAILKARQIPGSDTIDKIMEMAGPIVKDMVLATVEPMTRLGRQRMALFFQFMTYPRILNTVGPDNAIQPYQYTPTKIMPKGQEALVGQQGAMVFLNEFRYDISQQSMTELSRLSTKLLYIQLMKMGFPISWWDFAKIAGFHDFGPAPKDCNTMMERWVAQQHIMRELQTEFAQDQASVAAGAAVGGPAKNPVGRPPTFEKAPHLEQKDDGTRSTIATS